MKLQAGDYQLALDPALGGSIAGFSYRGQALMRATCGSGILDTACFPLVPFSNRIAHGRFDHGRFSRGGQQIALAPNLPGLQPHPHTIHGFGWLTGWDVVSQTESSAILYHEYAGGEWPWKYVAEQHFALTETGLHHTISLRNLGDGPMPAGLGFHPYFPCNDLTIYHGLHRGEWHTGDDGLPVICDQSDAPKDWWQGAPVGSRNVDRVYTMRSGNLTLCWPDRDLELVISPCRSLPFTVVYTPAGTDFFCVEPVSHATDAINRAPETMCWLDPDQGFSVGVNYQAGVLIKSEKP